MTTQTKYHEAIEYLAGLEMRCPIRGPRGEEHFVGCKLCQGYVDMVMWPMLRLVCGDSWFDEDAHWQYKCKHDCQRCEGKAWVVNYTPDMAKILDRLTGMDIDWQGDDVEFAIGDGISGGLATEHDSLTNLIFAVYEYCVAKEMKVNDD